MIDVLYIKQFYNEVKKELGENYKIILEPNRDLKEEWVEYDKVKWEIEKPMRSLVEKLLLEDSLSFEEKILEIYKFICLNYIYDDNVLFFFKRDSSNPEDIKYIAVDWYGRIIDEKWKNNRKNHNRRVCYEFARFFAKAINMLLNGSDRLEAFMVGDKENLHYVVGLTGTEYSAILDVDDFNKIKDLTRLKLGLTINGITILRDDTGKLKKAVDNFNENKLTNIPEVEKMKTELKEKNLIDYFDSVIDVLKPYNIDSQGFLEYMRSIIEGEGIEIDKVWKEIKGGPERRHVRCLVFELNGKNYLLDSVNQELIVTNKEKIAKDFIINPEKNNYNYYGV